MKSIIGTGGLGGRLELGKLVAEATSPLEKVRNYSHSIVAGGFEEMS
jgi:hypothetical protein